MKVGRLTITGSLGLIALAALGAAALRSPTVLWTQIAVTASLTCLLLATVAAAVGRGDRSFAIGFCIVGWGYLLLAMGPWLERHVGPWLLSTRIADEIYVRTVVKELPAVVELGDDPWDIESIEAEGVVQFGRHRRIAHSLFAIAHGAFGGVIGGLFARKGREGGSR